ncbi:MAG: DUF1501 domain-containing protein [Acidobacteria bacterium]|nr:DUF1501 domain-containing protein [Acidobacteriota bacterium]MBI3655743.1 DUF1501 domain-containing protein [Acidobacteriota bacterium]
MTDQIKQIGGNTLSERGQAAPTRREFIQTSGSAVAGYALTQIVGTGNLLRAQGPDLINTARGCIFIMLNGGPSHIDTFDIKQGSWTPADFGVRMIGDVAMPAGLFPNLVQHMDRVAIVRSGRSWSAVHAIAQYWIYSSQNFNPAFLRERPAFPSIMAFEYEGRRGPDDVLPPFVALNGALFAGVPVGVTVSNGFLSALYAPFLVTPNPTGVPSLTSPFGQPRFETFYGLLETVDAEHRGDNPPMGKPASDYSDFYKASRRMMYNPAVEETFRYTTEERDRYGNTGFGNACIVSRNLMTTNKGTVCAFIQNGGWDNHVGIYTPTAHYRNCTTLDLGLSNLITDLAAAPGRNPGTSVLDEVLIVITGDFGRTPASRYGPTGLNPTGGRDHWNLSQSLVFIGGGVQGGRAIGATDANGESIVDFGWSENRPIYFEDVGATIYSALGIDWTKEVALPSGRPYQYTRTGFKPVSLLFQ